MQKKAVLIGTGDPVAHTFAKRAGKKTEAIVVVPPLPLFKELSIGQKFKFKGKTFKKISAFAAYRNKVGLSSFGSKTQVEKI